MRTRTLGYSLIEVLVVLLIVGVLSLFLGNYTFQPKQKPAVQSMLSEVEGLVAEAHKYCSSTLGTVQVETTGSWAGRTFSLGYRAIPPTGPQTPILNSFTAQAYRDWAFAGVDDAGKMGTAVGTETLSASLSTISPDIKAELAAALANPLIGKNAQINPFNKQFLTPFCIPIVGLRSGETYPGAPAGMLVVTGNRIYKFYKAGSGADNPWRRL